MKNFFYLIVARGVTNEKMMTVQSAVTNLALLLKTTGVCVCVCSACVTLSSVSGLL